jgi:hypothetical protein
MGNISRMAEFPVLRTQTFFYTHVSIADSESGSTILWIPSGQLKATEFRLFLAKRIPLVITDLNRKLQLSWSPSHLIQYHGADICSLEDCEEKENSVEKPLKTFLARFSNSESYGDDAHDFLPQAIWKIKACT